MQIKIMTTFLFYADLLPVSKEQSLQLRSVPSLLFQITTRKKKLQLFLFFSQKKKRKNKSFVFWGSFNKKSPSGTTQSNNALILFYKAKASGNRK